MTKILIFAIPIFLLYLFINEYIKQKQAAAENWDRQWEERKKNFEKEKELQAKDREIQRLKNQLEARGQFKPSEESQQNDSWFSSN